MILYLTMIDDPEDKSKFEKIYYKYRKLIKYVANRMVMNESFVEDICSIVLIRIAENIHIINDANETKTKNLICILVRNATLDFIRSERHQNVHVPAELYSMSTSDDVVFDTVIERELFERIKNLPNVYRDVLNLRYYYGMSDKEIAKLLNITESTVRKRMQRVRDLLE